MSVNNKQDNARKNAKRASMRVRSGGVEYVDATPGDAVKKTPAVNNKNDNEKGKE